MMRNVVRVAVVGFATAVFSLGAMTAVNAQSNDDSYGTTTATTAGVQPTDDTRGPTATTGGGGTDDGATDVGATDDGATATGDGSLARTGVAIAGLLAVAVALLVIGRASIEASRRRTRAVARQQAAAPAADRPREAVTG